MGLDAPGAEAADVLAVTPQPRLPPFPRPLAPSPSSPGSAPSFAPPPTPAEPPLAWLFGSALPSAWSFSSALVSPPWVSWIFTTAKSQLSPPNHSYLARVRCALAAFRRCARLEGIIPALEPAHALAHVIRLAPTLPEDHIILMNLCGRGDKDVQTVASAEGVKL